MTDAHKTEKKKREEHKLNPIHLNLHIFFFFLFFFSLMPKRFHRIIRLNQDEKEASLEMKEKKKRNTEHIEAAKNTSTA